MRALAVALALLCSASALADEIDASQIFTGRPRLFFSQTLTHPRTLLQVQAAAAQGKAKGRLDAIRAIAAPTPHDAPDLALAALLDPTDKASSDAALNAVDALMALTDQEIQRDLFELALAYDWLAANPAFASRKAAVRARLEGWTAQVLAGLDSGGDVYDSRTFLSLRSAMAGALALAWDSNQAPELFRRAFSIWHFRTTPALCHLAGSWHEGIGFSVVEVAQSEAQLVTMILGATRRDPRLVAECGPLPGFGLFALQQYLPGDGFLHTGDTRPADDALVGFRAALDLLAATDVGRAPGNRSDAARLASMLPASADYAEEELWSAVLFEGLGVPSELPASPSFTRFGSGVDRGDLGLVVMRSGFDASSTVASFKAGDWFGEHDHLDQGGFSLWHKGWLAVDSGLYDGLGTAHREAYLRRSVAHNVLTVKVKDERFPSLYPAVPQLNEGGQRVVDTTLSTSESKYEANLTSGPHFETGNLRTFARDGDFLLLDADLHSAYNGEEFFSVVGSVPNPAKVHSYRRSLIWIGGKYLVIDDRVATASGAQPEMTWLLHTAAQPQQDGVIWTVQNGGAMAVRTVLPLESDARVVGGAGQEFVVDGRNLPPSVSPGPSAGTHRLEITPHTFSARQRFLHVLQVGDTLAEVQGLKSLEITDEDGVLALHLQDQVLLMLNGDASPASGGYVIASTAPLKHHFLGLAPNSPYLVGLDGFEIFRGRSSEDGTLSFRSEHGGRFRFARTAGEDDAGIDPDPVPCCKEGPGDFHEGGGTVCGCSSAQGAVGASGLLVSLLALLRRSRRRQ